MKNWEKAATAIGIIAFLFTIGVSWANLNRDIKEIGDRVARIEQNGADELCLQVVQRQMVAIENDKAEIQERLDDLARERGCVRQFDIVNASAEETNSEEIAARLAREKRERQAAQAELAEIDSELGFLQRENDERHRRIQDKLKAAAQ